MAAGVHGGRGPGLLCLAFRTVAVVWRGDHGPGAWRSRSGGRGLRWLFAPLAAAALGFAAAQLATARAPPIEADLPTHATIVTGTIRAVEALPEGRRITIQPAWLDGAAEPLRRAVRIRLQKKDDGPTGQRRLGAHPRADPSALAAVLSGGLGPAARRLLRRPGRVRLRAGQGGADRAGDSLGADAAGPAAARNHRPPRRRGDPGGGRRGVGDVADRGLDGDPGGRP